MCSSSILKCLSGTHIAPNHFRIHRNIDAMVRTNSTVGRFLENQLHLLPR